MRAISSFSFIKPIVDFLPAKKVHFNLAFTKKGGQQTKVFKKEPYLIVKEKKNSETTIRDKYKN